MHRQDDVHSFMYSYLQPSLEFGGVVPGCVDHFHCTSTNRVDVVLNTRTIRGHMTFAGRATPRSASVHAQYPLSTTTCVFSCCAFLWYTAYPLLGAE